VSRPRNHSTLEDVEVTLRPGAAVLTLQGEHDLCTKDALGSLMQRLVAENPTVLVDVTEADFIDSSVLHALTLADRQARAAGHRFVLVAGTKPIVETALRISGLIEYLDCASSVEEALSSPSAVSSV
jgi:anti-sigma B factor antagonist